MTDIRLAVDVGSTAYKQLHIWMNRTYPRTGRCEWCSAIDRPTHKAIGRSDCYTRNPADWFEFCVSCHTFFDGRLNIVGRDNRGEANGRAKLCEEQVREIRELYATGDFSQPQLARRFGVTHVLIGKIARRELWKEVV